MDDGTTGMQNPIFRIMGSNTGMGNNGQQDNINPNSMGGMNPMGMGMNNMNQMGMGMNNQMDMNQMGMNNNEQYESNGNE